MREEPSYWDWCPHKRGPEEFPHLLLLCEGTVRRGLSMCYDASLNRHQLFQHHYLGIPSLHLCENIILLFVITARALVYGTFVIAALVH